MDLKHILFLIIFLSLHQSLFAQRTSNGRYYLNENFNDNGQFYMVTKKEKIDTIGFFNLGADSTIYLQKTVKVDSLYPYKINGSIVGLIEQKKDTLKFESWFTKPRNNDLKDTISGAEVDLEDTLKYLFIVENWDQTWRRHGKLDVNFRQRLFGATSIPFRVDEDGNSEANFLNANITYLWIRGATRFYKSKFVSPFSIAWGYGPYLGVSVVDNADKTSKNFRPNIGGNLVGALGDLSIIAAIGAEANFYPGETFFNPYIGFGVGFKLVPLGAPSKPK